MRIQKKVKQRKKINITWWFVYLSLISCLFATIYSTAKYTTTQGDIAEIAIGRPVIEIIKGEIDEVNKNNNEIEFNVQNFQTGEEAIVNEVTLIYNVEIIKNSNIDLTYELYEIKNEEKTKIVLTDNKTSEYEMTHTSEQIDQYVLVLDFSSYPHDGANAIEIKINASQKIN